MRAARNCTVSWVAFFRCCCPLSEASLFIKTLALCFLTLFNFPSGVCRVRESWVSWSSVVELGPTLCFEISDYVRVCLSHPRQMQLHNGPLTSSSRLLFQSESKCEAFVTDIGFIRIERRIDYWNKTYAPRLSLKKSLRATQKCSILGFHSRDETAMLV